jgi:photosystem II stability/assembly factor-like uncharacterized protein
MQTPRHLILLPLLLIATLAHAQWTLQVSNTKASLRGLSTPSADLAWASGSKGTFLRTTDGGNTWQSGTVPGAEALDFRDVQGFDANTAYLLAAGPGEASRIFKTADGGQHWNLQFTNDKPKGFFDCMAFWDAQHGLAVSDPVDGHFVIITTADGGAHWVELPKEKLPPAVEGEGAFAASGTCIAVQGKKNAWFATGGSAARVFRTTDAGKSWSVAVTPLVSGQAPQGIFSIAFADESRGAIVGGDYKNPNDAHANAAYTSDGGKTWTLSATFPTGYRSSVAYAPGTRGPTLIAVGSSGSDYSVDDGKNWTRLTGDNFNAVSFAAPNAGWAVGPEGRIAKFEGAAPGGSAPSLKK